MHDRKREGIPVFISKSRLAPAILFAILCGCGSQTDDAAHQLLYNYVDSIANPGIRHTAEGTISAMQEQETKLHALKGQLPEDFYNRLDRLMAATRLSVATKTDDKASQQVSAYIQSITGSLPPEGRDIRISAASAFSEEAVRLEMKLNGETDREKASQKLAQHLKR